MLVGGILGYVFRAKVETTLRNGMIGSIRSYGNYNPVTDAWDETQARLHCCGVNSWKDWKDQIPDSCCREPVPGKRQRCNLLVENQNSFTLFQDGCYNVTAEYVKQHAAVIGGAGIIVAGLMVSFKFIKLLLLRGAVIEGLYFMRTVPRLSR